MELELDEKGQVQELPGSGAGMEKEEVQVGKDKTTDNVILLVGEGNFSFAAAVTEVISQKGAKYVGAPNRIIATDVNKDFVGKDINNNTREAVEGEGDSGVFSRDSPALSGSGGPTKAETNVAKITGKGGQVFLDVDATQLDVHPNIWAQSDSIFTIIFNFPHAKTKKMQIQRNRELLAGFFSSARALFAGKAQETRQVVVSLRKGQSGVREVEQESRRWADTWQIVEMAAEAGFFLARAESFPQFWERLTKDVLHGENCPDLSTVYESTGYRLQNTSFPWKDANSFTFQTRPTPVFQDFHLALGCYKDDKENEDKMRLNVEEVLSCRASELRMELGTLKPIHPFQKLLNLLGATRGTDKGLRVVLMETNTRRCPHSYFDLVNVMAMGVSYSHLNKLLKSLKVTASITTGEMFIVDEGRIKEEVTCIGGESRSKLRLLDGTDIGFAHHYLKAGSTEEEQYYDVNLSALLRRTGLLDLRTLTSPHCFTKRKARSDRAELFLPNSLSTGLLYPREFSYRVSFWALAHTHKSCTNRSMELDPNDYSRNRNSLFHGVILVASVVYGELLQDIRWDGEPFEDPSCGPLPCGCRRASYSLVLTLSSVDKPLSWKCLKTEFNPEFRKALAYFLYLKLR